MCVLYYMIDKWLKYFSEIPTVFLIANVLDPKWKLAGTSKILDFYYNNLSTIDLGPLQELQDDTNNEFGVNLTETFQIYLPNRSTIQHTFEFNLRTLYAEYEAKYNETHQVRSRPSTQQHNFGFTFQTDYDDPDAQSQLADLYGYTTGGRSTSAGSVSELDIYYESRFSFNDEGPTPAQIDVLDWWGTHEKDFPILASMAKEIFSVPASTVAVESAFSVGACVLDERRSNLSARNMEAVMLLDDWCKADIRDQEPNWDTRVEEEGEEYTEDEAS
ncbi:hypothetical protein AAHA92_00798 [Salvia divinorum]|uniref:HAT C-terminal dimerisation domain-containing protein n=1 Tax=Salvia divinorum TaxID=28513 RepID=A0ABD1IQ18_SALDI